MFRFFATSLLQPVMARLLPSQHSLVVTRFMGIKRCIKANKSVCKRFRVRGDGSLKRSKAGMSHNSGYKSPGRKARLNCSGTITEPKIEKRMKQLMGSTK